MFLLRMLYLPLPTEMNTGHGFNVYVNACFVDLVQCKPAAIPSSHFRERLLPFHLVVCTEALGCLFQGNLTKLPQHAQSEHMCLTAGKLTADCSTVLPSREPCLKCPLSKKSKAAKKRVPWWTLFSRGKCLVVQCNLCTNMACDMCILPQDAARLLNLKTSGSFQGEKEATFESVL